MKKKVSQTIREHKERYFNEKSPFHLVFKSSSIYDMVWVKSEHATYSIENKET
jgi:macrodomain Ter protein organizer (MatP/YcbG family)